MELSLEVVTAQRTLLSETKILRARITTEFGELGVEPGHTALLAKLKPGILEYIDENQTRTELFINGGILEIQPNKVTILADEGLRSEELDANAIADAMKKAQDVLNSADSKLDRSAALAQLSALAVQKQLLKRRGL